MIQLKRAYDDLSDHDGCRVLVDRIWPRGVSKEKLQLDEWLKEIAPTKELRQWFDHDPEKFDEFKKRYKKELEDHQEQVEKLISLAENNDELTLIFAAKDEEHNNAVVLKEYLELKMKN
ncbi:MAG TPA: DUF488 domain-containing protein [Balneolaceae bacterium]|nr:DUF488 domain-containing protein [Balneolaceae bacterium]